MKPKMTAESKKAQNVSSNLLSQEENRKIFLSLGKQRTTIATAVVQLFLTEESYHSTWHKKCCGVVCLVKDCERRSYFIKVFDMDKMAWQWEQELYNPFEYKSKAVFFHIFEADNCMAGLNFASNDEALSFESTVQKILQKRDERKRERRRAQQTIQPSNAGIVAARAKSESTQSLSNGRDVKKEKKRKKKLTKEDISNPTNFTHLRHVGWHPEKGFSVESVDQELKDFFDLAGVSDKDLKDSDTRNFIYEFIASHGGVERAKQEIGASTPPPVPSRDVPQTPRAHRVHTRSAAPPPPPSVPHAIHHHPTPPPVPASYTQQAPPAPPPPPPPPPPPAPVASTPAAPPPPPPPPPMGMPSPKPNLPAVSSSRGNPPPPQDNRSALLEQIRKGKELHHVEINGNESSSASSASSGGDDTRGALLSQIRQGIVLKSVSEESKSTSAPAPMDGLAGALARALLERNRAIQPTDESSSGSDEVDDGDEWD
ncbi:actin nucleation-promoting factor WASL-like isoform X2 [Uloborus diversus]|uniref:actin nucleation-promoting factor WASL-like isoform X2 n=1 Tax=Uloborus diversus TaxID=327109 RepID=UPI002409D006|nr:actin nucleation-promoting factor WASL-like isoform X2 [Uloborus diversus]